MPEPTKRAIELLQDLDLDISKQINSKNLDFLVEKLQKSSVSENRVPQIQSTKKFNKNSRYEDLLNRKKKLDPTPITEIPEFEVEKISEISQHSGLNKIFDLNQIFTVPSQILGPYSTLDGRRVFYKFYNYIDDFKVFFAGETQAAFIIPVKLKGISVINRRISTLNLSKGSVWIRADLLDPNAAKENYVGLKITSGNLALGGMFTLNQKSVQVPKTSVLEVDFVLENSYQFENTLEVGIDGKSSVFKPTEILKLKTGRNRLIVVEIGEFYGKTLDWESQFWKKDLLFHWDAEKRYMGLNLSATDTRFIARTSQSPLYNLKGQSRITQSEWLLPSRILNQNQSIEVKFNGFMGLNLEKGLMTNWDGIKSLETIVKANECKLKFFNGFFNLYSEKADFGYIHDRLTLWQKSEENLSKMEMDVNFKDYGMLQILSQSDLADSVSSYADTEFFIDKPLRADNTPVHPKTKKSFYGKIVTSDAKNMIVLDSNLLTEDEDSNFEYSYYAPKDEVKYQFVLENAYFTTTKETTLLLTSKYDDHNHLYEGNLMLNYGIFDLLPTLPHPYTSNWNGKRKERNFVNGNLQAITNWQTEDDFTQAEVIFKMNHQFTGTNKLDYDHLEELNLRLDERNKQHEGKINITNNFMLFDVSTQADHWGIALSFDNREEMRKIYHDDVNITSENLVTINRDYLQAPMGLLQGLTLPQVSWEPVVNITPQQSPADPQDGVLNQIANTIPTVFSQIDNHNVTIKKYLPQTYRNAFNFTSARTRFAVTDDEYECIIKNKEKVQKDIVSQRDYISWGKLIAFILRNPLLAEKAGLIYKAYIDVDENILKKGGWLYNQFSTDSSYSTIHSKIYSAKIPALQEDRILFAPVLFPVSDTALNNTTYDAVMQESILYNDGFAKIVHANQPINQDLLQEKDSSNPPVLDIGLRLGWDDEQLTIWGNRQLRQKDEITELTIDAPLGVFGYKIDVRKLKNTEDDEEEENSRWHSQNQIKANQDIVINNGDLIAKLNQTLEIPVEVHPSSHGNTIAEGFWLPMYYASWNGKSMVIPDKESEEIYNSAKTRFLVEGLDEKNALNTNSKQTFHPYRQDEDHHLPLIYGTDYEFRIRFMDISGGGPTVKDEPLNGGQKPIGNVHFKRNIKSAALKILNINQQFESQNNQFVKDTSILENILGSDNVLTIKRPELSYPSVAFTGKYRDAAALLKNKCYCRSFKS